jgi:PPOX class probable F420-dependent enzyme
MPFPPDELRAFLAGVRLCHWSTIGPDGRPRVRPLWYLHADGALWFTTRMEARRTGADVASGSSVAVSIASEERPYRAVLASGTPEVWDQDRDAWLERIATRYGRPEGLRWLSRARTEPDRVVLRMVPDRVIAWHYGKGDYSRDASELRVDLP